MNERPWYYLHGQTQTGPVPQSQLSGLLRAGSLARETLVWSDGLTDWQPAGAVADLWASERLWFYVAGNSQAGPVPESQLRTMLQAGRLHPGSLVWTEGMSAWSPVAEVPALTAGQGPASPALQEGALSPADVVLLYIEQFAAAGSLIKGGNFNSLVTQAKAGYQELTIAMFQAALLAVEQAGAVRLRLEPKKAMLGLKTLNLVMVEPLADAIPWPEDTFEGMIRRSVQNGARNAADIFTAMLLVDSSYPWTLGTYVAMASMERRGLLAGETTKKMAIFSSTSYRLMPHVRELMAAYRPEPVRHLLDECRRLRPDLFQAIADAVRTAVENRTDYDTD